MSSIREQIAAAVVQVLSNGPYRVHRERTTPIESDTLPAILVYFEDDEPTPLDRAQKIQAPLVQKHLNMVLELRAVALSGQATDEAIDPLYVFAVQQMMANEKFSGLAMWVHEGPMKWTAKEADKIYAGAALHMIVHYRTSRLDPTLPG